jgi:hypothetical protein
MTRSQGNRKGAPCRFCHARPSQPHVPPCANTTHFGVKKQTEAKK